jgi:N-succinyldiaminopimelate aminotransferase
MPSPLSQRVSGFGSTIFSEMSRLAAQHGAVNLGQGFPDFDGPEAVKEAARVAIASGANQYSIGNGDVRLRAAIAAHAERFYGQRVDPEAEVTVTAGATEALLAAMLGLLNPGDEVIVFEPYFDAYLPDLMMVGARPRLVRLRPTLSPALSGQGAEATGWSFDPAELAAAFNARTRMLLLNTPHNPTGKVFTPNELHLIAELCQRWNVSALTDDVYEHQVYDGARHVRLATLPGMAERTLTVSSLGKTFSFTGWKVGWAIAPPALTEGVRRAHQYITFCAPAPLQAAAATALTLDDEFYQSLVIGYQHKRDFLVTVLREAGFRVAVLQGTFYVMANYADFDFEGDDVAFCRWLTADVGVAAIPASAMYSPEHKPEGWVRFAFCKEMETLERAADRLRRMTNDGSRKPRR